MQAHLWQGLRLVPEGYIIPSEYVQFCEAYSKVHAARGSRGQDQGCF